MLLFKIMPYTQEDNGLVLVVKLSIVYYQYCSASRILLVVFCSFVRVGLK
jgi:hypothetical protein